MHIVLTGLNHRTAPLDLRERISFSRDQLPEALPILAERVGHGVILSTCNRTEVYTLADEPADAATEVRRFLSEYHDLDTELLASALYDSADIDAVRHLFRVASGLDSMIVGESEILGQVRGALTAASQHHSLLTPVSRLFHRAMRTGRRVRTETRLGQNPLSISYAAVDLVERVLGSLRGLKVMLVGAGEAGKLVAKALRTTGASELMIANRTAHRGDELARSLGGRAIPFAEVEPALGAADIVIVATEAPEYVLTRAGIEAAARDRDGRALFLFDLAVPRNIDPEAGQVQNVSLFNIDDLSSIAEENLEARKQATDDAERIVEEEAARFLSWWESLEAVPLINALRRQAERVRKGELDRALQSLPDISPEDAQVLDAMTRSIVNRLLHNPTISLKQQGGNGILKAARDLFRLWDDPR